MDRKLDVGEILQGTASTLSASAGAAAAYVVVLGAVGSVVDLYGTSANILSTAASVGGGFISCG